MAKLVDRLTALDVKNAKKPGLYPDGAGLYLRVTMTGTKNWVLRYMLDGRPRWMGLGPTSLFELSAARMRAADARRSRHDGIDPIDARREAKVQARLEAARQITFKKCATEYISNHSAEWTNAKHAAQWTSTLTRYAYPIIGDMRVQAIETADIQRVLDPIWNKKRETAMRVRQRMEAVLDAATALKYRTGENPARWGGNLEELLAKHSKRRVKNHHAALPYAEIGKFMKGLREHEGSAARALEFSILTAARTAEVIGATWREIDMERRCWSVPGHRMKAGILHRVPLNDAAMDLLRKVKPEHPELNAFIFTRTGTEEKLSNMAQLMLLRRIGRDDITIHGFRSTFRSWAGDCTNFAKELAEFSLAHKIGDAVEQAYWRSDAFGRRRKLMAAWGSYCSREGTSASVIQFDGSRRKAI